MFDINSKLTTAISACIDCILLSILWVLFSIPLVTCGAASSAMYYTYHKSIRQNRGYLWQNFFTSFKSNFKKSTIIWFLLLVISAVNLYGLVLINFMDTEGKLQTLQITIQIVLLCIALLWGVYALAYQSRFEDSLKTVLVNSGILMILNPVWSLILAAATALTTIAIALLPSLLLVFISLYNWVSNGILERVFRKNMTPEDRDYEISLDV